MASRGLRCICLAYTDYPAQDSSRPADFFSEADRVDTNLIAMAIVGIKDPVRWDCRAKSPLDHDPAAPASVHVHTF